MEIPSSQTKHEWKWQVTKNLLTKDCPSGEYLFNLRKLRQLTITKFAVSTQPRKFEDGNTTTITGN